MRQIIGQKCIPFITSLTLKKNHEATQTQTREHQHWERMTRG